MVVWNYLSFDSYPCYASEMTKNTLNHCLKFPLCFIFCHICYRKSEAKNFITVIKVKLLVSKVSNSCFKGLDFFQMLLASHNWLKSLTSSQIGWIPNIFIACILYGSDQQTRQISFSRTHRISTRLHMQHHIYLLSSLIISFYILTTLFLCYMFSKGHAMAHHGWC